MHLAASSGKKEILMYLIKKGGKIHEKNEKVLAPTYEFVNFHLNSVQLISYNFQAKLGCIVIA